MDMGRLALVQLGGHMVRVAILASILLHAVFNVNMMLLNADNDWLPDLRLD